MLRSIVPLVAVVATIALPLEAQTFRAENRVNVTAGPNNTLSISSGGEYGARGMWCAAADYAQDVLGARGIDRLVIEAPRTSTRGPVVFAVKGRNDVSGGGVQIIGASLRTAGANLSVDHAYQFCHDARLTNSR